MTHCGQKQLEGGDNFDVDRLFTGPINSISSAFRDSWEDNTALPCADSGNASNAKIPPLFSFGSTQTPIFSCHPHCVLSSIIIPTINYQP